MEYKTYCLLPSHFLDKVWCPMDTILLRSIQQIEQARNVHSCLCIHLWFHRCNLCILHCKWGRCVRLSTLRTQVLWWLVCWSSVKCLMGKTVHHFIDTEFRLRITCYQEIWNFREKINAFTNENLKVFLPILRARGIFSFSTTIYAVAWISIALGPVLLMRLHNVLYALKKSKFC